MKDAYATLTPEQLAAYKAATESANKLGIDGMLAQLQRLIDRVKAGEIAEIDYVVVEKKPAGL